VTDLLTAPALATGWWARGLALAERRAAAGVPTPAPDAAERAARRLERWREQHRLAESGQFARRLAGAGLTEAELADLLAEAPERLAARASRPEWAGLAEAVIDRMPVPRPLPEPAGPGPVAWEAGFSLVVAPFTEYGYERLAATVRAEALDELVDVAELRTGFTRALSSTLVILASRTLVLELNVLRVTDRLAGETPQQRFWSFVRHLGQRAGLVALLDEYPVLARLLAQSTGQAVECWLELLRRFAADRPGIVSEVFGGADPGRLVEVSTGRGDTHQRGRSVAILRFDGSARLVYKPRPLAVHLHFNECAGWLNRIVPNAKLRRLSVVDRGRYGWVEFAEHLPCQAHEELERYYWRQGALLALLYALDGADFHFENLIASGDQPVLVDMEALFHPALPIAGPELLVADPVRAAYGSSVAQVGLLPSMVFGEDGTALDFGGNGGDAGMLVPFKTAGWTGAGTDEMRLIREQSQFPGSQNRPRLGKADVDASDFADRLMAGFRTAYDAIVANREDLTGPGGLVRRFGGDELRVVARPTRVYGTLLYESTHPSVLRDALDRDRILDYLWAISADDPGREELVEHEQRDLWAGDVPLFTARTDGRDVWAGDGARLREVLATDGLRRAVAKVQAMGPADRRTQEWIIRASFASRSASTGERGASPAPTALPLSRAPHTVDPGRTLTAARAVGDQLADSAYLHGDRVGWLGLHFVGESQWVVQPLGWDLYGGYPGVALFLGQLAALTAEQRYADLALRTLAPVQRYADEFADMPAGGSQCSAFNALPGLAYALVHAASDLGAPQLRTTVEQLLAGIAAGSGEDEVLDVIGGSAGGLVAMLAVYEATGLAAALEVARACADRLMETAKPQPHGVAWEAVADASQPLTGFSHGAAGMGWALLRFAAATGERRYAEVGLDAFAYERSQYSARLQNWPDFRVFPGDRPAPGERPPAAMSAWCHGAPGIGLSRADSGQTQRPEVAADLDLAVRGLVAAAPSANLSLCHGQLGNLELLTLAGGPERAALAGHALATFEKLGPVCGTPLGTSTPGLMVGLAGIGHGLLRLGFPDRVPSALLLQPPRAS
jgi:class II lanthipeptide synthase